MLGQERDVGGGSAQELEAKAGRKGRDISQRDTETPPGLNPQLHSSYLHTD